MRSLVFALLVALVFSANSASAEGFAFFAPGVRHDSEATGLGFARYNTWRLGGGYFLSDQVSIGGDLGWYRYSTGTGNVEIQTDHVEILFWGRYSLWKQPGWLPYGMFGLGLQKRYITTTFQSESSRDEGKLELFPSLGIGSFNRVWEGLSAGGEVRTGYRAWASPRLNIEMLLMLGWLF